MKKEILQRCIFDSVASKKVIKVGYVALPGGIYSSECDSVASHSFAVSVLAMKIAYEVKDDLDLKFGIKLNIEDLAVLALFHDYGETRSLDTGAQSKGIYPNEHCRLHSLEKEGLETITRDLKVANRAVKSYDHYRDYDTPESIIVHIADNLEGFEKAIHCGRGNKFILNNAEKIFRENIAEYESKEGKLGEVCKYLLENYLVPGTRAIIETYGLEMII